MRIKYENEKEKFEFKGNIEEFNVIFEAYKSLMLPAERKEKNEIIIDKNTHSYVKEFKEEKDSIKKWRDSI